MPISVPPLSQKEKGSETDGIPPVKSWAVLLLFTWAKMLLGLCGCVRLSMQIIVIGGES